MFDHQINVKKIIARQVPDLTIHCSDGEQVLGHSVLLALHSPLIAEIIVDGEHRDRIDIIIDSIAADIVRDVMVQLVTANTEFSNNSEITDLLGLKGFAVTIKETQGYKNNSMNNVTRSWIDEVDYFNDKVKKAKVINIGSNKTSRIEDYSRKDKTKSDRKFKLKKLKNEPGHVVISDKDDNNDRNIEQEVVGLDEKYTNTDGSKTDTKPMKDRHDSKVTISI